MLFPDQYCIQVWTLHLKTDTNQLETVQEKHWKNLRSRKQDVSYILHKLELFITVWKTNREDTDAQAYKKTTKERNILCFQWLWWGVRETDGVKIQFRWWTEKKRQTNSNFKKRFQFSKNRRDLTGKVTKDFKGMMDCHL